MDKLMYYTVTLDGIDKTGKDTIFAYFKQLCGCKYLCNIRGIISQTVYSQIYNRDIQYDLAQQKYNLNVLLTVDKEDWEVRCKMNNEPMIDYDLHNSLFLNEFEKLAKTGFKTLIINTSKTTPYEAAKLIINKLMQLNIK